MYSCIILCGGRGERMGEDKGLLIVDSKPLILHVLEEADKVASDIILVLRDKLQMECYLPVLELFSGYLRIVFDEEPDQGPLMGIYTGLQEIRSDKALILPCDSPYISTDFLETMYQVSEDSYQAYVPRWADGRCEPLHAIYNKNILSKAEKLLSQDVKDVKSLLKVINVKYIPIDFLDSSGRSFLNFNRPEDVH